MDQTGILLHLIGSTPEFPELKEGIALRYLLGLGLGALIFGSLAPSTALAQLDSDFDGSPDVADAFPCDPTRAGIVLLPAQDDHGMIFFEDTWPKNGDLDFNDAVVTYNYAVTLNGAGKATSIAATYNILAVGGTFDNGLAVQFPVPADSVDGVYLFTDATTFTEPTIKEDDNLTVQISENLREFFDNREGQINSRTALPVYPGATVQLEIVFAEPQTIDLSTVPYDVFLFRSENYAHQIHAPQYSGTSDMDGLLFNIEDDASTPTRHFVNAQGLPFVLHVPNNVPWASEEIGIASLFPNIIGFASSGGTQNQDFYSTNVQLTAAYTPATGTPPTPTLFVPQNVPSNADTTCVNPWLGASSFGSINTDRAVEAVADSSGFLVAVGHTDGALPGHTNIGATDGWVTRHSGFDGSLLWSRQFGTTSADVVYAVDADDSNSVHVLVDMRGGFSFAGTSFANSGRYVLVWDDAGAPMRAFPASASSTDMVAHGDGDFITLARVTRPGAVADTVYLEEFDKTGARSWFQHGVLPAGQISASFFLAHGSYLSRAENGDLLVTGNAQRRDAADTALVNDYFIARLRGGDRSTLWFHSEQRYSYVNAADNYSLTIQHDPLVSDGLDGAYLAVSAAGLYNNIVGLALTGSNGRRRHDGFVMRFSSLRREWSLRVPVSNVNTNVQAYAVGQHSSAAGGDGFLCGSTRSALPGYTQAGTYDSFIMRFRPDGSLVYGVQHGAPYTSEYPFSCQPSGQVVLTAGYYFSAGNGDVQIASHRADTGARN